MASKRDLVEAHGFNRRRLVTAFLSGAPGGREVEPARYGRTIVGGAILAALLLAGAGVAGKLKPTVDMDWLEPGMVVGKESGSRFLTGNNDATKGTLFPVLNTASARLAYADEKGQLKVTYVPEKQIAKQPVGVTLGIPGAPDVLPKPSGLIGTGWTACTNEQRGLNVRVATTPGAAVAQDRAVLVSSGADGSLFLIAGSHRYPVPKGRAGIDVLRSFGLDTIPATPVSSAWLDLVKPGSTLTTFIIDSFGDPAPEGTASLRTIGTPVLVDGNGYFVLVKDGILPLTPFAYAIYKDAAVARGVPEVKVRRGDLSGLTTISSSARVPYPRDWPEQRVTAFDGSAPCLLLQAGQDANQVATALLARHTDDAALAQRDQVTTDVQTGHGALVQATTTATADGSNPLYLLDSLGTRYAVGGSDSPQDADYRPAARQRLGFPDVEPQAVPQAWLTPFDGGPPLLRTTATRPAAQ